MLFDPNKYQYINCNGNKIAYQRSGQGATVLMIHGITSYSFIWRKLIPELDSNYDLIRLDLPGCGQSEMALNQDLSLKNHAKVILDFIQVLNLGKIHLVGHDIGGGIVQIMAVQNAEKYYSVSMLNPVGYDFWPVQPINSMRSPIFRQFAMAAFDLGYYKSIVRKAIFKEENVTEELLQLFWSNFSTSISKKAFLRFAKCLNNKDLMEISAELKTLDIPALILRAEKDAFLSAEITRQLSNDIPNSRLEIIPESGHYMQEDAPEQIAKLLQEFWSISR